MFREGLDPKITDWLTQQSFGPDIVHAFEEIRVWSLEDLSKCDDVRLMGSLRSVGIKAVPAKKVYNAVRNWKAQTAAVSTAIAGENSAVLVAVVSDENQAPSIVTSTNEEESTLLTAEASSDTATLQNQLNIESQYIEKINVFLLSEGRCKMTAKALNVLKFSKTDHQTRMQRLKTTIQAKLISGNDSSGVLESKVVLVSPSRVRFAPFLVRTHNIVNSDQASNQSSSMPSSMLSTSTSPKRKLSAGSGLSAVRQLEAQRMAEQEAANVQQRLDLLKIPGNWECTMCKIINEGSSGRKQCRSCFTARPLVAAMKSAAAAGYRLMSQPSPPRQAQQQQSQVASALPAVVAHKPHAPIGGAPSGLRRSQVQTKPVLMQAAPPPQQINNQVLPSISIRSGRPALF